MKVQDISVVYLGARRIEGVSKHTQKAYDFIVVEFGDERFNKFEATLNKECREIDGSIPLWMADDANKGKMMSVELSIVPKKDGDGLSMYIESFEPIRKMVA